MIDQSEHVMAWTVLFLNGIQNFTPPCSQLPTRKHFAKPPADNRGEIGANALRAHHSKGVKAYHPWTNSLVTKK